MTKQVTLHKCTKCGRNVQRLASHMKLAHAEDILAQTPPKEPQSMIDKTAVITRNDGPFTKDDLLTAARRPGSAELQADQQPEDDIEYRCDTCNAKVGRTDNQCRSCGRALLWDGI